MKRYFEFCVETEWLGNDHDLLQYYCKYTLDAEGRVHPDNIYLSSGYIVSRRPFWNVKRHVLRIANDDLDKERVWLRQIVQN